MWTCSLELVDECSGGSLFSAPAEYRGDPACRPCIDAVGPAAGAGYDDVPATQAYEVTD